MQARQVMTDPAMACKLGRLRAIAEAKTLHTKGCLTSCMGILLVRPIPEPGGQCWCRRGSC